VNVPLNNLRWDAERDHAVPRSKELWAPGVDRRSADAVFLHYDGSTWALQACVSGGSQGSITAMSPTSVWTAGGGVGHWDGVTWAQEHIGGGTFPEVLGIAAVPHTSVIWAVGDSQPAGRTHTLIAKRTSR
jgi:hypothetical protein